MGGSDLDLNDAELRAERTELTVFSLMGGAEIRVPEGLNVEVSELRASWAATASTSATSQPDPGGPVLHVRLFSIMGGTDVTPRAQAARRRSARERQLHQPALTRAPRLPDPIDEPAKKKNQASKASPASTTAPTRILSIARRPRPPCPRRRC